MGVKPGVSQIWKKCREEDLKLRRKE